MGRVQADRRLGHSLRFLKDFVFESDFSCLSCDVNELWEISL